MAIKSKEIFLLASLLVSVIIAVKLPQNSNPQPLSWWQQEVIYQIDPRLFQGLDGNEIGDLQGILSQLDHFTNLGVGAILISSIASLSVMEESDNYTFDFTDIGQTFGTLNSFQNISQTLKQKGIRVIIDLVPNHTSDLHPWFNASIHRQHPYTDYYVWQNASSYDSQGRAIPPNNWVGVFGGSMWEWNDQRQQFYLHQFLKQQPDLNFENSRVLNEVLAVMKIWLDRGVDGFHVKTVPHLFEELDKVDEEINDEFEDPNRPPQSIPLDYSFWQHRYTYNLPACLEVLAEMRKLLDVYALADGKERVMMVEANNLPPPKLFEYYGTPDRPMAHFPLNLEVPREFNASQLESTLALWFDNLKEGQWANWLVEIENQDTVTSRFEEVDGDLFNMIVLMLLPGSAVIYYDEEIGMQELQFSLEINEESNSKELNDTQVREDIAVFSHEKVYKKLVKLRNTDVWRYGSLETKVIDREPVSSSSSSVFGFTRTFNGNGFIVLINTCNSTVVINAVQEFEGIPPSATASLDLNEYSQQNYDEYFVNEFAMNTSSIVLDGRNAIVLQF